MKLKTLFLLLVFIIMLFSCSETTLLFPYYEYLYINDKTKLAEANFNTVAHTTTGTALIYEDTSSKYLVLESFKTEAGPEMRVYLATDNNATDFVDMGVMKSKTGTFYYKFSKSTDITKYKRVLIWCKTYSALFGYAVL